MIKPQWIRAQWRHKNYSDDFWYFFNNLTETSETPDEAYFEFQNNYIKRFGFILKETEKGIYEFYDGSWLYEVRFVDTNGEIVFLKNPWKV